jgi:hypothetical protein
MSYNRSGVVIGCAMITAALVLALLAVHIGGNTRYAVIGLPFLIGGLIILHDGTTRMSNERRLIIGKPGNDNAQPDTRAIIHTVRRFALDGVPTSRREAERYGIDKQTWQATYDALKNIDAIERVDNRGSWRIRKTFTLDRIITQLSPLPR